MLNINDLEGPGPAKYLQFNDLQLGTINEWIKLKLGTPSASKKNKNSKKFLALFRTLHILFP